MKLQFFTIPVHNGGTQQKELNSFLAGHRIVTVEKEFVVDGQQSFWSICISYLVANQSLPGKKGKVDYREVLSSDRFAVFAQLRSLRKQFAERESVPAYTVFTNEQLAAMTAWSSPSLTKLGQLPGVGKARLEKYGRAFLALLQQSSQPEVITSGTKS